MERPKRLYFFDGKLSFTYSIKYTEWFKYDNDDNKIQWHGYDESAIGFGLSNRWFGIENVWYDGHTFKAITLFHIIFFKTFTYQSEKK